MRLGAMAVIVRLGKSIFDLQFSRDAFTLPERSASEVILAMVHGTSAINMGSIHLYLCMVCHRKAC